MPQNLSFAIIAITLALVFYTIGVWSERLQKSLKPTHLVFFWIGLIFDTVGTAVMSTIAEDGAGNPFHAITGALAIILMLAHAVWATYVLVKKDEKKIRNFHKFSIFVWFIWLIPYISGVIMGMNN